MNAQSPEPMSPQLWWLGAPGALLDAVQACFPEITRLEPGALTGPDVDADTSGVVVIDTRDASFRLGPDQLGLADPRLILILSPDKLPRRHQDWLALNPVLWVDLMDPAHLIEMIRASMAEFTAWSGVSTLDEEELARLTRNANYDELTGLLRRHEVERLGTMEVARSQRNQSPLSAVMADIDHFKRVNDVFGHAVGDRTLQRVARLLGEHRRAYDILGRVGGEEFLLVFQGMELDAARGLAEQLRVRIETFPWQEEALPQVTLSFGVAELTTGGHRDLASLMKAADDALYQAKRHGRNRVWVQGETTRTNEARLADVTDDRRRLLVIDDSPVYLADLKRLLKPNYWVEATLDPREALAWAGLRRFDAVLTDLNMPHMPGTDVLARIRTLQPDCVRMIMSAHGELNSAIRAINEGEVFRYILKPWNDDDLLLAIHQAIEHQSITGRLRKADRETIRGLSAAIELRDRSTRGHYHRVAAWSLHLAEALGYDAERASLVEFTALLHDIGKVGIPDSILKKKTPFTAAEEKIMRDHTQEGANIVAEVEHLSPVAPFIRHHHERWDGLGQPDGLAGEAIPEVSRIVAIANAFDGYMTPRRHQMALDHEAALAQIRLGAGKQFDPGLVERFARIVHERGQGESSPGVSVA